MSGRHFLGKWLGTFRQRYVRTGNKQPEPEWAKLERLQKVKEAGGRETHKKDSDVTNFLSEGVQASLTPASDSLTQPLPVFQALPYSSPFYSCLPLVNIACICALPVKSCLDLNCGLRLVLPQSLTWKASRIVTILFWVCNFQACVKKRCDT